MSRRNVLILAIVVLVLVVGVGIYILLRPLERACYERSLDGGLIVTGVRGFRRPVLIYFYDARCEGDCHGGFGGGGYVFSLPSDIRITIPGGSEKLRLLSVNPDGITVSWKGVKKRLVRGKPLTANYTSKKLLQLSCSMVSTELRIEYLGLLRELWVGGRIHLKSPSGIPLLGIRERISCHGCNGSIYLDFPLTYNYTGGVLRVDGWMQHQFWYPVKINMLVEEDGVIKPFSGTYESDGLKLVYREGRVDVYYGGVPEGTLTPGGYLEVDGYYIRLDVVDVVILGDLEIHLIDQKLMLIRIC